MFIIYNFLLGYDFDLGKHLVSDSQYILCCHILFEVHPAPENFSYLPIPLNVETSQAPVILKSEAKNIQKFGMPQYMNSWFCGTTHVCYVPII